MRIELKENNALLVAITDEQLDNDNFVELDFDERVVMVSLDELMSALIAFDAKRSKRLSLDEAITNLK